MAARARPTVLVVDDSEDSRTIVGLFLKRAGLTVKEAATGTEALRVATEHPDLIVLDVRLPDIDGFEVCRRLKSDARTAAIPVLHLSAAYRGNEERARGLLSGADGYLTHPVEPAELVATARALLSLRSAQARWRAAFDRARDPMMLVDPDGRWVQVNRAACDLLGGSERDLVGRRLSDSSGPSSDVRRGRREAPESRHADVAFPDGSRRTLRYSTTAHLLPGRHLVVLSDIAGGAAGRGSRPEQDAPRLARLAAAVTKHVNAVRRISERREAEDVRRQLASIVESSEDAIIGQTLAGLVFSWNQGAEKMYGYGADEVKGRSLSILGLPAHEHDLAAVLGKVRGGERVVQYETVHVRKDGTPIDVSLTASPLRDEAGRIWGVSSIIRDISDRKRADEGLRKSEEQLRALTGRVESVREEERAHIAREIHDELGQALTALKIDMAALAKKTAGRHTGVHRRIQPMLKAIDDTIESVRRISSQLRPGVLDVLGVVAAIEWQAREFEARTGIGCRFTSQVEDLAVDREQSTTIFRIFQESLTNVARHAQASTVDVVLRTSDGRLTLTVRDNGKGITEAQVRDINSLGLVGMRERALLLGGELSVSGLPGEETTVVLSMPVRRAPDGDRTE